MMSSVSHTQSIFYTEVMRGRFGQTLIFSSVISTIVGTLISKGLNTLISSHSWNPFVWITTLVFSFFDLSLLIGAITPFICNIVLIRIQAHSFSVSWWVPENRFEHVRKLCQWKSVLHSIFLTSICCILFHHYASIALPSAGSLVQECTFREGSCLNHQCLVIIVLGLLYGLRFAISYSGGNLNFVSIPFVHPGNVIHAHLKLRWATAMEAYRFYGVGIWFLVNGLIFYVFAGPNISSFISTILSMGTQEKFSAWQMVVNNINLNLILVISASFFVLSYHLHCFFTFFNELCSKPLNVPISDFFSDNQQPPKSNSWTLANTLVSNCGFLQSLAFKHIKDTTEDESIAGSKFREQIFAISQPGGHPHNWNGIVNPSMNLIRKFSDRLKAQLSMESTTDASNIIQKHSISSGSIFTQKVYQAAASLKQYPLFCYLLATLPEAKVRQVFADAQPVIYAVQGLSNIVAASYTQDNYGVVQRNFKDILTALIDLQQLVEKSNRSTYNRKTQRSIYLPKCEMLPQDIVLRKSLRLTIRSSIYTITTVFKDSIREVDLSTDVRTKVLSYLSFQEG